MIECLRGHTAPKAVSAQVNCPHCGERLASLASVYCCYCGGRLERGYGLSRCLSCRTPIGDDIAACIVCGAPFPETIARLRLTSGPLAGEVFRIPAGDTHVGRQQLLPGDRSLSRQHIRFTWNKNGLVAHNLKASNPSLINGVALTSPRQLMVGDTIVLGMSQGILETL
ncbi:MAG: FHA domain-containing protein [Phycisphaerae bacterium]